jgi:hypothetical protein
MAVVLEASNKVWQKVEQALTGAGPDAQRAFKGLRDYLVQQSGNPNLQFIPYTAEQAVTDHGVDLTAAACKVYGWYGKGRRTSGTTASFIALNAAATQDATTTTIVTTRLKVLGQRFAFVFGAGLASETGLTVCAATTVGGATESSAADAADGFVVIGAA